MLKHQQIITSTTIFVFFVQIFANSAAVHGDKRDDPTLSSYDNNKALNHNQKSTFRSYDQWCRTQKTRVAVTAPGCRTKFVKNNYCYGQCNSYYLPSALTENVINGGRPTFMCHICAPVKLRVRKVYLNCPNAPHNKRKRRRVQIVEECRCVSSSCSFVPAWA